MSFKHKLVAFFIVLSALPLAAAFWGFNAAAERSESRRVDARLQAGLRAALAAYQDELSAGGRQAERLAADPLLQRALVRNDRATLADLVEENPDSRVRDADGLAFGGEPELAGTRRVSVLSPKRKLLGTVTFHVPLDDEFLERLRRRAALNTHDRLLLARDGKVVAGLAGVSAFLPPDSGGMTAVDLGREEYRVLSAALLSEPEGASIAVASPTSKVAEATRAMQLRLLFALAVSLLVIGLVAYLLGRGIVRTLARLAHAAHELALGHRGERVAVRGGDEFARLGHAFNEMAQQLEERLDELEQERNRLRDATKRFGEALGATHDPDQLLRVVVETAVEATGAAGGVVVDEEGRLLQAGQPKAGRNRIELPLTAGRSTFGTLILTGDEFNDEQRETAASLAAHAVIALENARLHRIVERQALVDGLTGLANRRNAEETLGAELARSARFGTPLAVVVADLDDFKAVNDTHGHPAGDAVLREFAQVLRDTLREIDLASRWGGEEFALVLPGTDLAGGVRVAERIRAALEERTVLTPEGAPVRVTASFGVAAYPDAATAPELIGSADAALYAAKRAGKNRVLAGAEPARHP